MKNLCLLLVVLCCFASPSHAQSSSMPPGTVVAYAGEKVPNGWLLCDGSAQRSKDYPALYRAIGTSWGNANTEAGNFNLPDMRGMFLRGVDGGKQADPNASERVSMRSGGNDGDQVGSYQDDSYKSHSHTEASIYTSNATGSYAVIDNGSTPISGKGKGTKPSDGEYKGRVRPNTANSGEKETRPKNVYVHYIIKY